MTDWRMDAACRDHDPELWHPVGESGAHCGQIAEAKAVCARCPVAEQCLADALTMPSTTTGIWGGTTETERRALVRKGRRDAARASAADEVAVARGLVDSHAARGLDDRDKTEVMRVGCGTATVREALGVEQ